MVRPASKPFRRESLGQQARPFSSRRVLSIAHTSRPSTVQLRHSPVYHQLHQQHLTASTPQPNPSCTRCAPNHPILPPKEHPCTPQGLQMITRRQPLGTKRAPARLPVAQIGMDLASSLRQRKHFGIGECLACCIGTRLFLMDAMKKSSHQQSCLECLDAGQSNRATRPEARHSHPLSSTLVGSNDEEQRRTQALTSAFRQDGQEILCNSMGSCLTGK